MKDGYHHGDLRTALVGAARKLLEDRGPDAVTLRTVATRAGVSHAAPYHHFADKGALLAAVAADGFRALEAALAAARGKTPSDGAAARPKAEQGGKTPSDGAAARPKAEQGGKTARERLHAMGLAYVRFARERPALFRLMCGPDAPRKDAHPELLAASLASFSLLTTAAADAAGKKLDPELVTVTAWCVVHGFSTLWIDGALQPLLGGRRDPEKLATQVLDLVSRVL